MFRGFFWILFVNVLPYWDRDVGMFGFADPLIYHIV